MNKRGTTSSVTVAVRIRPLSEKERLLPEQTFALDYGDKHVSLPNESTYVFDSVFGPEHSTAALYDSIAEPIVSSSLAGINGTIFAYGQTASGKTFTMQGGEDEPGILRLAARQLFNVAENADWTYTFVVSYIEIYNEKVKDLLNPAAGKVSNDASNDLKIREDRVNGFYVDGVVERVVMDYEALIEIFQEGERRRHVAGTDMNLKSSRSHTVFAINVTAKQKPNETGDFAFGTLKSRLSLVDLAGSESARLTNAEGERLKEGAQINKSLLSLSLVISSLAKSAGKDAHVKFRDSKLTQILQPSLAGNCRTAVVCCVTPAATFLAETASTLKFASSAKVIQTQYVVNQIADAAKSMKSYQDQIEALTKALHDERIARGAAESAAVAVSVEHLNQIQKEYSILDERCKKLAEELALKDTKLSYAKDKFEEAEKNCEILVKSNADFQKEVKEQIERERDQWQHVLQNTSAKLSERTETLQNELKSLKANEIQMKELLASLHNQLEEKELALSCGLEEKKKMDMQLEQAQAQNATLNAERDRQISEQNRMTETLKDQNMKLLTELLSFSARHEEKDAELGKLKEDLREAYQEFEKEKQKLAAGRKLMLENQQISYEQQLKELQAVRDADSQQHQEELSRIRSEFEERHRRFQIELDTLRSEHEVEVKRLKLSHEIALQEKIDDIRRRSMTNKELESLFDEERQMLTATIGDLSDQLKDLNEHRILIEEEVIRSTEAMASLEQEIQERHMRESALQKRLDRAKKDLNNAETMFKEELEDNRVELEMIVGQKTKIIAELEAAVLEESSKSQDLIRQIGDLKASISRLRQEHDTALDNHLALSRETEDRQLSRLRKEMLDMRKARDALQQQFDEFRILADKETDELKRTIADLQSSSSVALLKNFQEELEFERERNMTIQATHREEIDSCDRMINELKEKNNHLEKVKMTKAVSDKIEALKHELRNVRKENEKLNEYKAKYVGLVEAMHKVQPKPLTSFDGVENIRQESYKRM